MAYRPGMRIENIYVYYNGEGRGIPYTELDIEENPTEGQIKLAVEGFLGVDEGTLRSHQVDAVEATGQVVLRPDSRLGAEDDVRMRIMNSLLSCPHRDMTQILALHKEMMEADPEFYAHFAVWAQGNTKVRDHNEAFIACLFACEYTELREVAYVLMQDLPPYQVDRIRGHVQGAWVSLNIRPPKVDKKDAAAKGAKVKAPADPKYTEFMKIKKEVLAARAANRDVNLEPYKVRVRGLFGLAKDADIRMTFSKLKVKVKKDGKRTGEVKDTNKVYFEAFRQGLNKNPPRIMRSAITSFLRVLERDEQRFDRATARQYDSLRSLYASMQVAPSPLADAILFKDNPPEGTLRYAIKRIAKITDPVEWAQAVVSHNVPYPIAVGLLGSQVTPTHLVALINQMSSQELLNSLSSLEERGALENPDVKALIDQKLGRAAKAGRVDALKAQKAVEQVGDKVDAKTRERIENVTNQQVRKGPRIKRSTALIVDTSTSMSVAIEHAKEVGTLISASCNVPPIVVTFSDMGRVIDVNSDKKTDWDNAFRFVKATGWTNAGAGVDAVVRRQEQLRKENPSRPLVEQFLLISDEGENRMPSFTSKIVDYARATGVKPNVVIWRCGKNAKDTIEKALLAADIEVDVWEVNKDATGKVDYYSLPNLIALLSKGSKTELLSEIMEIPLPRRSDWDSRYLNATPG